MAGFVSKERRLRNIKVKRLTRDVDQFIDMAYMPIADDEQFIRETRESVGVEGGAHKLWLHDFTHVSEGAFKSVEVRISEPLSRMRFLKRIDRMERGLI